MRHAEVINHMTLEEKVALGSGQDNWRTKAIERLGIPSLFMADGPHGLRKQETGGDHLGLMASVNATCFPTSSALASSFNPELLREVGEALGKEARAIGVNLILGPGVNMKRNPLCGRNFEYYSEDPFLAGRLAAAWIQGVQAQGVGVSLKHFACNNQEKGRMGSDSLVDERALREYYLAAFEHAVKEARPAALMSAYNKLNGVPCSDNRRLLWEILREEWGFEGAVISDWGGTNDRAAGIRAGLDLEMPGSNGRFDGEVLEAIRAGQLDEEALDRMVSRLLDLIARCHHEEAAAAPEGLFERHHLLARRVAARCGVLLKNEGGLLPLTADKPFAVIGELARTPRYQGTGSSQVSPTRVDNLLDGLRGHGLAPRFAAGYLLEDKADEGLLEEAAALAAGGGMVILCLGLTESYESEGYDRGTLALPQNQTRLLEALREVNSDIAVVLAGGSAVEMPWIHQVRAVLHMQLSGQAGGPAAADLLLGASNPAGRLAETYPLRYEDVISSAHYGRQPEQVPYYESMYAGYRYFDSAGVEVLFPFGHGLSYTRFEYSDLKLEHLGGYDYFVHFTVKNTGERDGAEAAQLYIAPRTGGAYRPRQELKGFASVYLRAGESRELSLPLDARSFATYSIKDKAWQVEGGAYEIRVGASSRDIRLVTELALEGVPAVKSDCDPWYYSLKGTPGRKEFESNYGPYPEYAAKRKGQFDLDSSLKDMARSSLVCKLLYRVMEKQIARVTGGKVDYGNPQFKMMMDSAGGGPIKTLALFIPEQMPIRRVRLIVDLANGRMLRGLVRYVRDR